MEKALEKEWKAQKQSLLRKLLEKDIHKEQLQLLQIIRYVLQKNKETPQAMQLPAETTDTTEATEAKEVQDAVVEIKAEEIK